MQKFYLTLALAAATLPAQQAAQDAGTFAIPGTQTRVKTFLDGGELRSAVSVDAGKTWGSSLAIDHRLHLRYGVFDPLTPPAMPGELRAGGTSRLFVVQFHTQILSEFRAGLQGMGVELTHYLPSQSYLVRMDRALLPRVEALPYVRSVSEYHLAYRLAPEVVAQLAKSPADKVRYTVVLVNKKTDAVGLEGFVRNVGGVVHLPAEGGILFEATMDRAQLLKVANDDRTLWIQTSSEPEKDIDNARIQGGTNYVETQAGIAGKGMRGHIMEGVYSTHPEFAAIPGIRSAPIAVGNSSPDSHGTNTAGEIYASGVSPTYKGLSPNAQMLFTNYTYVYNNSNRYPLTKDLVDPTKTYKVMAQTASWGYARNLVYDARSAEMDDIIFDFDLFITQSQSNAGATSNPQMSRPQAWAKNIVSAGGFYHRNNSNPADDCWCRGGSTGPASDGRIGVTLSAYYDSIGTTNGTSGYTSSFGGTSGATPIVQGLGQNTIEMFTDGLFGYGKTPDINSRFDYLPHFSTTKALLVATASQVTWNATGTSAGANRYQQGFGMPNVRTMYDNRNTMLVIDELDVLQQGQSRTYYLWTPSGTGELHAAMNYPDPAAAANAAIHRINSVDLQVKLANGTTYWGNNGLTSGPYSTPGGTANDRDTEESVIVSNPPAGITQVTVMATGVRQDGHIETSAADIDYALVVRGVGGMRDRSGMNLVATTAPGSLSFALTGTPASGWDHGYTLFSAQVSRPVSTGNVLGLELDGLTISILGLPASAGDLFHFTNTTSPTAYPNAPSALPAAVVAAIKGVTFDAVAVVFNGASVVGASNVERFKVQ
ncbi:MAG: peptidase S8 [Planctomycetes bacterium]|nr:peptidase S8 [Planctomycetota bacterium]MCB9889306.1 peptidase S8 [Planctomycetota bacterium]